MAKASACDGPGDSPGTPPRPDPGEPRFALDLEYLLAVASAWLLPGAGHWVLGNRVRAVVLGGSILGLFWAGELLALSPPDAPFRRQPLAVTRQVHPIFFACQVGNGFSTLLANSLWGEPRYEDRLMGPLDPHLPLYLNLGILLTSVSGLLNYLLVLHVLDPRSWVHRKEGARGTAPGGKGP